MPLESLVKQYAGAYADGFDWPRPSAQSDDDGDGEVEVKEPDGGPAWSPPEAVLIDSLLSVDQYRCADKAAYSENKGKAGRDIAEVAAATEVILPKGSFRTSAAVRLRQTLNS